MTTQITNNKLTPEFIKMFSNIIAAGNYPSTACKAMRLQESTFRAWMRIGKAATDGIYKELYDMVMQAEAKAEVVAVEAWVDNFKKDAKAPKEFLSRRYPDRWAERKFIQVAVEREIKMMLSELQRRLPEDIYSLVISELAAIDQEGQEASLED